MYIYTYTKKERDFCLTVYQELKAAQAEIGEKNWLCRARPEPKKFGPCRPLVHSY